MLRLVVAMAITVAAVVFVMANTHQVNVSFVFGGPVKVRMIFLLMTTFVTGAVVASFFAMITRLRLKRHVSQRLRREEARAPGDDLVVE